MKDEDAAIQRGLGRDRVPRDDSRADRGRSSDVNAVILRLAEYRKKVCHL